MYVKCDEDIDDIATLISIKTETWHYKNTGTTTNVTYKNIEFKNTDDCPSTDIFILPSTFSFNGTMYKRIDMPINGYPWSESHGKLDCHYIIISRVPIFIFGII